MRRKEEGDLWSAQSTPLAPLFSYSLRRRLYTQTGKSLSLSLIVHHREWRSHTIAGLLLVCRTRSTLARPPHIETSKSQQPSGRVTLCPPLLSSLSLFFFASFFLSFFHINPKSKSPNWFMDSCELIIGNSLHSFIHSSLLLFSWRDFHQSHRKSIYCKRKFSSIILFSSLSSPIIIVFFLIGSLKTKNTKKRRGNIPNFNNAKLIWTANSNGETRDDLKEKEFWNSTLRWLELDAHSQKRTSDSIHRRRRRCCCCCCCYNTVRTYGAFVLEWNKRRTCTVRTSVVRRGNDVERERDFYISNWFLQLIRQEGETLFLSLHEKNWL